MVEASPSWSSRMVAGDGVSLHVRDMRGREPAVVVLHGLAGHGGEWGPFAVRTGHRVVAVDLRGHGRSTRCPEDLSREAFVGDVIAVIEELGLHQVAVVGQSMGAHTALLVAAARPRMVNRLVLVEGGVGGDGPEATDAVVEWLTAWPTPFVNRERAIEYFGGGLRGREWAAGLVETDEGLCASFDIDVISECIDAVHATARWAEWSSIGCSVLLVRAGEGFLPVDEVNGMLTMNRRARAVTVGGSGHDIHLDAVDTLVDVVGPFLRDA